MYSPTYILSLIRPLRHSPKFLLYKKLLYAVESFMKGWQKIFKKLF